MADLTYAQLEQVWLQAAKGTKYDTKAWAALMAAIALAESSGDPSATNPDDNDGTQTSWGLWQISLGNHSEPSPTWDLPLTNAQLAIGKLNAQGLDAWGTYTSGAYKQYYSGGTVPSSGPPPASGGDSGSSTPTAEETSLITTATGTLSAAGGLLHDAALALNFAFEFFKPGQAERLAFGAVAVGAGYGAFRLVAADEESKRLPVAILLAGTALMAGYMAARPWPQASSGRPVRAAAYVHEILGGSPPSGPPPSDDTQVIEYGLVAVLGVWAASKAAGALGSVAQAVGSGGSIIGDIWNAIKGAGEDVGEAAEGGGE